MLIIPNIQIINYFLLHKFPIKYWKTQIIIKELMNTKILEKYKLIKISKKL